MKTLITTCLIAASLAISAANIVLIGDSTLAPRDAKTKLGSWGDALKPSLAPGNGIVNRSVGGRTVRTTKPSWVKSLEMISNSASTTPLRRNSSKRPSSRGPSPNSPTT